MVWPDDGSAIASDHFSRRLHALMRAMAALDLNGCVADAEPIVKLLACADQQGVIVANTWFHQMCGESDIGCAHTPNVKVVNVGNVG